MPVAADVYELYAVRYGVDLSRPATANFIPVPGFEYPDSDSSLHLYVWVAVSGDRVVMIDGGAGEATARGRGFDYERNPIESLRVLGIDPGDVGDVVVTHLHWDHAGNLRGLPGATVHLHPAEIAYATGPAMSHRYLRRPYDLGQIGDVVSLVHDGRVNFTDRGVTEVAPGLTVHPLGGHTPGMQVVRVPTARGVVVVASDARHYYANGETGVPFPVVVHMDDYCAASVEVDRMAESPDHVIAGHDPSVTARYPAIAEDELIMRLDVPPESS